MDNSILKIEDLSVAFQQYVSFFEFGQTVPIKKMDMELNRGEILVVVGQSGSGKSLVAHAIMDILPENAVIGGHIYYNGEELKKERRQSLRQGEIVFIPQSISYLDPLMTIGKQIESLVHDGNPRDVMLEMLEKYDLEPEVENMYPFQISGGMARRILIACAMVQNPDLIIADEPTPGLDMDLVDETVKHLLQMKADGCSLLVITHDLHVATRLADRIIFFNDGHTVAEVKREEFMGNPGFEGMNTYARQLFAALPENEFTEINLMKGRPDKVHELKADHVSFSYTGNRMVFMDLNFSVKSGEIIGLTGHSGRGKTTLAKLLSGYLKPTAGKICLDGKSLYKDGKNRYNPVQLILQHPENAVDPKWKMSEILAEPGVVEKQVQEDFNIKEDWLDRYPKELSGGELQRFSIVRVLNKETLFLIADESTTMFDAYTQAQVWKIIVEYVRKNNIGMILISHDILLLERLCDKIIHY